MNEKIKQQAQELYPPEEKASEYVAFLRGARMVIEPLMKLPIDKAPFKVGDKVIVKGYEKMDEDEVICVFKTYFGDIKLIKK